MSKKAIEKVEYKLAQGHLGEARELCARLCKKDKRNADAWNLLGIIDGQLGDYNQAITSFQTYIGLLPDKAEGYFNLAMAQAKTGLSGTAEENYKKAIRINPKFTQAYNNLGVLQARLNNPDEAIETLKSAINLLADNPNTHRNLGLLFVQKGRLEEAEKHFKQALNDDPEYADVYESLGMLYVETKQSDKAASCFSKALEITPNKTNALIQLGKIYLLNEVYVKAEKCYRQVLASDPNHVVANLDLALIFEKMGELNKSLERYLHALRHEPDNMRAHNNISILHCMMGNYQEAVNSANKAISLAPDSSDAYNNLANAYYRLGELENSAHALRRALDNSPDEAETYSNLARVLLRQGKVNEAFDCHSKAIQLDPAHLGVHSSYISSMNYSTRFSRDFIYQEHLNWAKKIERDTISFAAFENIRDPDKRLRIGYLSPDFCGHSVSFFFEPILNSHDHMQCEVFCYSDTLSTDETSERMKAVADHWRQVCGLSDGEVMEIITKDQIDILVDLAGHTADNRLTMLAKRAAPVQISYLGYPNTTGLGAVDYLITDNYCDPEPEADTLFAEKLMRMPNAFFCYKPPYKSPEIGPLPALKNAFITFASFNNLAKIGEEVIELWAAVLLAVPGSRLLFQCLSLNDPATRERYEQLFKSHNVSIDRINFVSSQGFDNYLEQHNNVDIILDTFPWNGHTVSCHALWMGVPVITLCGDRHASRMGASLLSSLGLDDFIAREKQEFIDKAVKLSQNINLLTETRASLRDRMRSSPICDEEKFTKAIESIYRTVWQTWCATQNNHKSS